MRQQLTRRLARQFAEDENAMELRPPLPVIQFIQCFHRVVERRQRRHHAFSACHAGIEQRSRSAIRVRDEQVQQFLGRGVVQGVGGNYGQRVWHGRHSGNGKRGRRPRFVLV